MSGLTRGRESHHKPGHPGTCGGPRRSRRERGRASYDRRVDGFYGPYVVALAVAVAGVAFVAAGLQANRLLRPAVPTRQKQIAYESGVDPVGSGWAQTHVRYYVYAFLYVVFAVDAVYLFPWATVFALPGFGAVTLVEMGVFLGIIAIGILYAARKGVLTWR